MVVYRGGQAEDIAYDALLLDFYGELLSENQRNICSACMMDDMSLSEISEEYGISRQAVSAMLGRCRRTLRSYEERLKLVKRFQSMKKAAEEILKLSAGMESPQAGKISILAEEILKGL